MGKGYLSRVVFRHDTSLDNDRESGGDLTFFIDYFSGMIVILIVAE